MLPLSAKHSEAVEKDGITYQLATPTLFTRAAYRRDLTALGATLPSEQALGEAMRDGIRACVADDQQNELIEIVNSYEVERDSARQAAQAGEALTDEEQASLTELTDQVYQIEGFLQRESEAYAGLLADRAYYLAVAPIAAFRRFVTGWEGEIAPFRTRGGLVDEQLLEKLPKGHVDAIGWQIILGMSVSEDQRKNSASQSSSAPAQGISTAAEDRPTAAPAGT